jgi:hypothetical protein
LIVLRGSASHPKKSVARQRGNVLGKADLDGN